MKSPLCLSALIAFSLLTCELFAGSGELPAATHLKHVRCCHRLIRRGRDARSFAAVGDPRSTAIFSAHGRNQSKDYAGRSPALAEPECVH